MGQLIENVFVSDATPVNMQLTKRDFELLELVWRYRVATVRSLHQLMFPDVNESAVTKVTRRMVRRGWLLKQLLGPRLCYFSLSAKAAALFKHVSFTLSKPIPPHDVIRAYGLLEYCCMAKFHRSRLTFKELREQYPALICRNMNSNSYFWDKGYQPPICGIACIDLGLQVAQFVEGCRKDWEGRMAHSAFRKYVNQNGFCLVLVTSAAERASVLQQQVDRYEWPEYLRLKVEVVPQMLSRCVSLECAKDSRRSSKYTQSSDTNKNSLPQRSNARPPVNEPQLTNRDYEILLHVMRHRIATPKSICKVFFSGLSHNASVVVTTRLIRNGWLLRHEAAGQRRYFTISSRTARLLGNPSSTVAEPLTPPELVRDYAVLKYCCADHPNRKRLATHELLASYPQLLCPDLDSGRYFFDSRIDPVVPGLLWHNVVDNIAEMVDACHDDWQARWKHATFRNFVNERGIHVVFLATSHKQLTQVSKYASTVEWPKCVRLSVETIPEITLFLNMHND